MEWSELLRDASTVGATGVLSIVLYLFITGKIVSMEYVNRSQETAVIMQSYVQRDEDWKVCQQALMIRMVEAFERIAEGVPAVGNGQRLRESLDSMSKEAV